MFRKLDPFPPSGDGRNKPTPLSPLERVNPSHWKSHGLGANTVGVSLLSPEFGNRDSFRNAVFPSYLEFRTMDKVPKIRNFECYIP
jgi:hypothetical protein